MTINFILTAFLLIIASASASASPTPTNRNMDFNPMAASTEEPSSSSTTTPGDIFLLAGQSNMAGRGGEVDQFEWDGITPPECTPNPRILRLNNNSAWEEAREPLHRDIDTTHGWGVGPGMPFANSLLARGANIGVIGLVPCADGGTSLGQWTRGNKLYKRLVGRAINATVSGGRIRAMLWYQGESDANNTIGQSRAYKGILNKFFTDLRSDLRLPTLPVIQVALASGGRYIQIIREAQLHNDLPNVVTVDAMGLPLERDNLHLTTAAQVRLGGMLADAFLHNFCN